jgi:hypothetical protein
MKPLQNRCRKEKDILNTNIYIMPGEVEGYQERDQGEEASH